MGDNTDAPRGVTAGELAAVLQAMDEKYRSLFDALSRQVGSSRAEVEAKEEIHPLQLPHVKLEGAESYASWAEHAETILVSRKLEGYILGTIEKPAEESSKEGQRWKMTNALVRAWLLSSLSPQIAKQVERIKEASEIWRLLKSTYSGAGNEMMACRIQKELQGLCQGEKSVVEYELGTGRRLGTGRMHDGLYYLDNSASPTVAAVMSSSPHEEFLLLHRRLGHMSFAILGQLYPNLYNKIRKERLACDACQYGKQTRSTYVASGNRSDVPLQIIHSDVWGPSGVVSINGYRYFVTFIDCCTRTTWVYVLRNK
ncbi:hypothetical protein U9M48_037041, partial [Paspalum notatum var. saurae]